jgi:glycosyltransferase involved in cell wall biosynthesis
VNAGSIRHLGVNALFLQPRMGGIGTYVLRLLPAMLEARPDLRVSVIVNDSGRGLVAAEPWSEAVKLVHGRALGLRGARAFTETFALGPLADRRAVDVIYSAAMTGPLRSRAARVVAIHDLIWLTNPDPGEWLTMQLWRRLVPPVARRAQRVVTLASATRDLIEQRLGVDPGRIDVVPHGREDPSVAPTPEGELRSRLRLGRGPVVLAVSAAKTHKNLSRLIEAMPAVIERHPEAVLVVPGNPTALAEQLARSAAELRIEANVRFPGWVDDADLEGLYRVCSCLAFPSLVEGFGLPVLEAMARGVPVACSRASSIPEVGGDAVLYFDPLRPPDIAAAVGRLLDNRELAARLGAAGRERSALFSWRRTAELTLESCERAAAARWLNRPGRDGSMHGSG